jgi:SAM-dependent methyltransferase
VTLTYPERIVPDETDPGIVALHLKRYEFAARWCRDASVLDAGCGVGYGSAFLGESAAAVLGVDVSEETIDYARRRYGSETVAFRVLDLAALDLPDASFDAVCAFEVIEHVDDPEAVLAELARVLRDTGTLVVSTPQVAQTTRSPDNPFHHVEYARADFEALLRGSFAAVELYGQRRLQTRRHRLMQRLDVLGLRKRLTFLRPAAVLVGTAPMAEATADDIVIERTGIEGATELVAVCTRPRRP